MIAYGSAATPYDNSTSGTSCPAGAIAVSAGDLLIAVGRWEGGGTSSTESMSFADSDGNTWHNEGWVRPPSGSEDEVVQVGWCQVESDNASLVVTGTISTNRSYRNFHVLRFTAEAEVELVAAVSGSSATNGGTYTSASALTHEAGDLIATGIANYNGGQTKTPAAGTVRSTAAYSVAIGYIPGSAGSYTPAGTISPGDTYAMRSLQFREVSVGPTITDVDTDEVVLDGQTSVAVTGTDMGADETERTFTLRQGSTSVPQTETGSGTDTAATLTIGIEQSGADIKFGSATLRVTRTDDDAYGEIAITVNPPTGQLYVDIGTPDSEADNRITAVDDIASGDQIQARGEGGGAAPAGLNLESDGTFWFEDGETPTAFDVRVWDASDATWGAWATQSMAGAGAEAVASDTLTLTDSGVSVTERLSVAADTLTLTDSGVSVTQRVSAAADTLSLSDSSVSATERVSAAADTLTLSDSAVGEVTSELAAVAEDALTLTDSALSVAERVSVASDTLTLTEEAISTTERVSAAADTVTLSDSAVGEATAEAVGEASDALTLTDSALSVTESVSAATDAMTLADSALSITELLAAATDTLTTSDSALAVPERLAVAVDTLALSDSAVGEATSASVGTASDTVTLSDSALSITERVNTATDTLTLTEEASSFSSLIADASDAITVSDSAVGDAVTAVFADAEDSIAFSDASLAELLYAGVGEDSLALSDSATSFTERISVAIDALTLSDEAQSYTERLAAALDAIGFSGSATAANASSFVDLVYIEFALRARRVEFSLRSQLMRLN